MSKHKRLGLVPVIQGRRPPPLRAHAVAMVVAIVSAALIAGAVGVSCGTTMTQPATVRWAPCR